MGIFSSIKDAIFGKKKADPAPNAAPSSNGPIVTPTPVGTPNTSAAISEVDVESRLDSMAGADRLNWRTSIVDLMKLIGVDSSLTARKALAQELGYTGELDGSAEMNIWLHRKTMQELARNGGKVPAEFID